MKGFIPLTTALVLASTMAACSGGSSDPTAAGLAPTAGITETFTGTVAAQGSDFHNFTVAQAGPISVTLTAAGPPATIFMGLGVGTPSSATCALLANASTIVQASNVAQLSGTVAAGTYCVLVNDAGNQVAAVTYSVTVVHP